MFSNFKVKTHATTIINVIEVGIMRIEIHYNVTKNNVRCLLVPRITFAAFWGTIIDHSMFD